MSDLLVRDIPENILRNVDERARQLGVSRQELLRRLLVADFAAPAQATTAADLQRASSTFADLLDDEVMAAAWR
jgi:hypothetical protein